MRRITLVLLAVFLATGLAATASLSDVSEAREGTPGSPEGGAKTGADGSEPYFQLVDNAMRERFRAPGWERQRADSETYGKDHATAETSADVTAARFRVRVPKDRYYTVYARWPAAAENTGTARFGIPTASGKKWDEVDQRVDGGFWVRIGAYEMEKGERFIKLEGSPGGRGRLVADAVMIVGDALIGPDGRTASFANPDELAPDGTGLDAFGGDEPTFSTRTISDPKRSDIVRVAKRHLGTPYGNSPCRNQVREDCSCHTLLTYRVFGYRLPDSPVHQWRARVGGKRIHLPSKLRIGDLVFHDLNRDGRLDDHYVDHVSIYAGNGNIIHASNYYLYKKVVISEMKYLRGFWGGRRLPLN